MKNLTTIITGIFLSISLLSAQKKPLTHDIYPSWKLVAAESISDDGNIVTYEIRPQVGDRTTVIQNLKKSQTHELERSTSAAFFNNQKWISYTINPSYDETRKAKIDKVAKDKMPKASVGFINLSTGDKIEIKDANSHSAAENAPIVAYKIQEKEDTTAKSKTIDYMIALDVEKMDTLLKIKNIKNFSVSKYGEIIYFAANPKDSTESLWVWSKGDTTRLLEEKGKDLLGSIVLDKENGKRFAFSLMTDKDNKRYDLYDVPFDVMVPITVPSAIDGLTFSNLDSFAYSKSGNTLNFSLATPPVKESKDTIPSDEKFVLDIWSYTDTLLQSEQLVQQKKLRNNTFKAIYDVNSLTSKRLTYSYFQSIEKPSEQTNDHIYLIADNSPYTWSSTWSASPRRKDIYAYYPDSNERELLIKAQRDIFTLSPSTDWLVYYNIKDGKWYSRNMETKTIKDLTGNLGENFFDEEFDYPTRAESYGFGGWIELGGKVKSEFALIYDRYDIWLVDPSGKSSPRTLTKGRQIKTTFRVINTNPDEDYVNKDNSLLLSSFNEKNKNEGLYSLDINKSGKISSRPSMLAEGPYKYTFKKKARNSDKMVWTRENYNEFPDLHVSDMRLNQDRKISDANPEIKDYLWGSAELINWTDQKGVSHEGILYLPENYDPNKKYPTIVYFYERIDKEFTKFYQIVPSWSIVIPPMYTSNDYVIFIPDLKFETGHPGKSGMETIMSGTEELIARGVADPARIGLQGQSWAGYLINYIITKTDLFCCASAGAGVSNMTSAYTGIRLGTGISRMVQYEAGQSRIGQTLWEAPELYLENSPLFFLDKVNTPLLLRHSDNDDAVPFNQSIEMFNGLRRLGKPVWLLNYHGEFHNMRRRAPRTDWSIRMQQFFDHYLKDAPAPRWMTEGVKISERGKDLKLELVE